MPNDIPYTTKKKAAKFSEDFQTPLSLGQAVENAKKSFKELVKVVPEMDQQRSKLGRLPDAPMQDAGDVQDLGYRSESYDSLGSPEETAYERQIRKFNEGGVTDEDVLKGIQKADQVKPSKKEVQKRMFEKMMMDKLMGK